MAKNKNRKQGKPAEPRLAGRAGAGAGQVAAAEAEQRQSQAQGSPADVARKHQRRFGHN